MSIDIGQCKVAAIRLIGEGACAPGGKDLAVASGLMIDLIAERNALLDALAGLHAQQNGPPLNRDADAWHAAMRKTEALLEGGAV